MMYTALDMVSTRTQIYLTVEQRTRLDALGAREGKGLAAMIREAVDRYLAAVPDPALALSDTFGTLPELEVPPRGQWDRG